MPVKDIFYNLNTIFDSRNNSFFSELKKIWSNLTVQCKIFQNIKSNWDQIRAQLLILPKCIVQVTKQYSTQFEKKLSKDQILTLYVLRLVGCLQSQACLFPWVRSPGNQQVRKSETNICITCLPGQYTCTASNGVGSPATATVRVEVQGESLGKMSK